jgi:hypothetical protein
MKLAEVTNSSPHSSSCVDMSEKKIDDKFIVVAINDIDL